MPSMNVRKNYFFTSENSYKMALVHDFIDVSVRLTSGCRIISSALCRGGT